MKKKSWSLKLVIMILVTKENWSLKIKYKLGFGYQNELVYKLVSN